MTNPRRIGFVVHAGKNNIGDRDALLRWIAEDRPTWMGTLNDYDLALARDMIAASPETKVLTRFIDGGEKTHYRRSGFITEVIPAWATLNGATHPNIYFNALCEPTLESELDVRQMVAWMTTFMAEMARHNMKLAGPHLGDATWHPYQIDGGWYDDLLYAMHTYPQHIFTVDEYGGPSLPNSINHPAEWQIQKDKVQPGMWPSRDSLPIARQPDGSMPPYYLILRIAQFIIRSRQLGLGDGRWLISEWGNDRIDELQNKAQVYSTLEQRYSWPKPYLNIRGAATLQYVYDDWREGVSLEDAIADADLHTEALYPDCVEGMLRYFWCYNHPDDYSYGFNIAPWRTYHRRLIQAAQTEVPAPVPAPEPLPVPVPVPTPTPAPVPFLDNWPLVALILAIGFLIGLFARTRIGAQAAPLEATTMWAMLVLLAGGVNRASEVFRSSLNAIPYFADDTHVEVRRAVMLIFSLAAGVVSVFLANMNGSVFAGTEFAAYPTVFVSIVFGLAVGGGANFIHFLESVYNVNKQVKLLTASSASTSAKVSVDVQAAEPQAVELKQAIDKISKEAA